MPSAAFETTVIFLVIEERCCVRSCLYSKGQFISKNGRTFLAMIVYFEGTINRQKLSKSYHLVKIGNLVKIFALTSFFKENHMFFEKITDYQYFHPVNDMFPARFVNDIGYLSMINL